MGGVVIGTSVNSPSLSAFITTVVSVLRLCTFVCYILKVEEIDPMLIIYGLIHKKLRTVHRSDFKVKNVLQTVCSFYE